MASAKELEVLITLQELEEVVDKLPDNKSPDLDGLLYEFYRKTGTYTMPALVDVFNVTLSCYKLSVSMATGAVRLTPKVKTPEVPGAGDLRLITLLSCDCKLLTKVLTARLVSVLGEILLSGQLLGKEKGGG